MGRVLNGCLSPVFRMIVSGASGSGKTSLINDILVNRYGMMHNDFDNIIYVHGVKTKSLNRLKKFFKKKIRLYDKIPEKNLLNLCKKKGKRSVLVLEDVDSDCFRSKILSQCFTKFSHHHHFSIILSTQNFFGKGSERLTLMRNATHLVLFENYLDHSIPRMIASRIYPQDPRKFLKLFSSVTRKPFGYVAVYGNSDRLIRLRTGITCSTQRVFVEEEDLGEYMSDASDVER